MIHGPTSIRTGSVSRLSHKLDHVAMGSLNRLRRGGVLWEKLYVCVRASCTVNIIHLSCILSGHKLHILVSRPCTCLARESFISYTLYKMKYSRPQTFKGIDGQLEKYVLSHSYFRLDEKKSIPLSHTGNTTAR